MLKVQNNFRKPQATRGRNTVLMLCMWMTLILCYQEHKECRNYVQVMPVEEKNSGRESRHCYLEVKVPERSRGVSG